MAIALDAQSNFANFASGASVTLSHTCSGSDRVLLVGILSNSGSSSDRVTGVTYNGDAMSFLGKVTFGSGESNTAYIYGLLAPDVGTHDIIASFSPNAQNATIAAVSYTGVLQSGLPDAVNTASGTSNTLTESITTIADNCWLAGFAVNRQSNTVSAGANTTLRGFDNTNTWTGFGDSNGAKTPPGAFSLIFTRASGSQLFSGVIVSIAPTTATDIDDARAAEIHGQVTTNASRAAEIRGEDSTSSTRAAEISGAVSSERAAEIHGLANTDSSRAAEVTGIEGADDARAAEIRGQTTTNAARAAEIRGQTTTNAARAAETTGIEGANATRAAQITGAEQAKKSIFIKAYTSAGVFLGVIADASFNSFVKRIDEGLGEGVFSIARKFDESGVELVEGNLIEVFISDKETVIYDGTDNTGVRRVYQGRISGLSLSVSGGEEKTVVRCMGHWVALGLDVLKSSAQTSLYTRSTGGVGTTSTPQSVDIGSVVRGIMDRYLAETTNPPISYTTASVPTVGSSMSYVFRQRTYREALQKCLDAAPYGHYSYVDENGIFSFKAVSTTPDHKFYFEKHFADIEIHRGITRTRNFLLLWAPTASAYRDYSDGESILRYGRQVERVTDANIQDTGTMDLVGARFIEQNKNVEVRITARILDSNGDPDKGYDIEGISPGDVVAFYNFDASISSILRENMIVTEVVWTPDYADITVEPVRLTSVADITSRLKQMVSEEKTKDGTTDIPDSHS